MTDISRSRNIYRSMSALTSLIRLSTVKWLSCIAPFFIAVSRVDPFISYVDALVDTLEYSNPEKRYFRALVDLAKATTLLYFRTEVPIDFHHDVRRRMIQLLHAYRYVLPSFSVEAEVTYDKVWRTRHSQRSH